ncbi:MAG: phage portal protein [Treponema sp.]|jgi:HK97 family phage portal protein|nr:phage portal protein [Treponema sp.]
MGLFDVFNRKKQRLDRLFRIFSSTSDTYTGQDATSFAAVDLICSSFASLSGAFYSRESRQAIQEYPLYDILQEPNADETKFELFYQCAKDYINGNCYLYQYRLNGELAALIRFNPAAVLVKRDPVSYQKQYSYNGETYTGAEVLHIPSRWGYDGLKGMSLFDECRAILSASRELDQYSTKSFTNSIGNRLLIDISKEIPNATKEQLQQYRDFFLQTYASLKNAGVPLVKSGKIEYSTIQTDFKDNRASQLVENRKFQEQEVAKLFGVPLALLTGAAALLTGAETQNLESLYTIFIENAIRPLATSFEQAINKLIPLWERGRVFFEYNYNGLLKTSLQARVDAYIKQIGSGILSVDEVRKRENLSAVEAGNTHFVPANLMPLTKRVIDSYMASAALKAQQLTNPLQDGDHAAQGDDKG